ncbi:MAG: Gfo/Idh/MocA family oxidoreductase [Bacteroidota bacterium]
MSKDQSRRDFIKKTTAGTLGLSFAMSARSYSNILGANDRINVCFMGLGRRVGAFYPSLGKEYNSRLSYLCDPKQSQVDRALGKLKSLISYVPKQEPDIRKVLEDKKIDAVFIAPPDHWHAPATVMALDAGKHVYVEKPCAHNPKEAEIMVARQESTGKMVQMGNQQRSSEHTIKIIQDIHDGRIGTPYKALAFYSNSRGEVPMQKKQAPPEDLDWELFQGPAPRKDYTHDTWNYNWHWYGWDYGTAETGNNSVHELDIARWALQVKYPKDLFVRASKNHFINDGWEMYDTMYASFMFDENKEIIWDGKSRNSFKTYGAGRGTIIYGTKGSVWVDRSYYELFDRDGNSVEKSDVTDEGGTGLGGGGSTSTQHVNNFYEAIRGKETLNSPIHDGAVSNHMALLANIGYRVNKPLSIDSNNGRVVNNTEAMKLWSRAYEPGWEMK